MKPFLRWMAVMAFFGCAAVASASCLSLISIGEEPFSLATHECCGLCFGVRTSSDRVNVSYHGLLLGLGHASLPWQEAERIFEEEDSYRGARCDINGISLQLFSQFNFGMMRGLSFSGLGSLQDNVQGVQISGLYNKAVVAQGIQVSLIANIDREMQGLQVALANDARKALGLQVGALNVSEDLTGAQFGLVNRADMVQDRSGAEQGEQTEGVGNAARKALGLQVGALSFSEDFIGAQLSGLYNTAAAVQGLQVAFVNRARETCGLQVGVLNFADELAGMQLSGLFNKADSAHGIQTTLITNSAREMHGIQVGLFNFADDLKGVQIGLFNVNGSGGNCPLINFGW